MSARKLDGRLAADRILQRLQRQIKRSRRRPRLATILVGPRYDSALYVKLKVAAARRVGILTERHHLPARTTQAQLHKVIQTLNARTAITGILLQLPLPKQLNADAAVRAIDPRKDVDGFQPDNHRVVPPPVAAILKLIDLAQPQPLSSIVVLGRRSVLTTMVEARLSSRASSVSVVPTTRRIPAITGRADIIITILGRGPKLKAQHIKRGAIVIDVGIRHERGKTVGDVDPSIWTKAKAVSPVPGGVGPLTVAYVLENTYRLAIR